MRFSGIITGRSKRALLRDLCFVVLGLAVAWELVGLAGFSRCPGPDCRAGLGLRPVAVEEAGTHQRQRVFGCAFGSGEDDGLRDALVQDALAQPLDCARIAEEFCKTHKDGATGIALGIVS